MSKTPQTKKTFLNKKRKNNNINADIELEVSHKDQRILELESMVKQLESFRDEVTYKLDNTRADLTLLRTINNKLIDEHRKAFIAGRQVYAKLQNSLKAIEERDKTILELNEQLDASRTIIDNLDAKIERDTANNTNNFIVSPQEVCYADDYDDEVEDVPITITRGRYTFNATVNVDRAGMVGECSGCLSKKRIVKSCCTINYCTLCYFKLKDTYKGHAMVQLDCELCYQGNRWADEPFNPVERLRNDNNLANSDDEREPNPYPQYIPHYGYGLDWYEESDEVIDLWNSITKRMWFSVMNAIRHCTRNDTANVGQVVEHLLSINDNRMSLGNIFDTLRLMLETTRIECTTRPHHNDIEDQDEVRII